MSSMRCRGRPLSGTRLHLFRAQDDNFYLALRGRAAEPIIADEDGHFTFHGLGAHPYSLQAELPHEIAVYSETEDPVYLIGMHLYQLRDWRIDVGPKSEGRSVIFRIAPQAILTGSVRDDWRTF
jgi:hypothetical protein